MSKNLLVEKYVPVIRLQGGYNSKLPITLNGTSATLSVGGTLSVTGTLSATGLISSTNVLTSQILSTPVALGTTGAVTLTPSAGMVYTDTPTGTTTINAASAPAGQPIWLVVTTSGTSSFTITFGTNFKTTGTLATGTVSGKVFTMAFISDGTNFNEVARTVAM